MPVAAGLRAGPRCRRLDREARGAYLCPCGRDLLDLEVGTIGGEHEEGVRGGAIRDSPGQDKVRELACTMRVVDRVEESVHVQAYLVDGVVLLARDPEGSLRRAPRRVEGDVGDIHTLQQRRDGEDITVFSSEALRASCEQIEE